MRRRQRSAASSRDADEESIHQAVKAFDSDPAAYDPRADLDRNGKVNEDDEALFSGSRARYDKWVGMWNLSDGPGLTPGHSGDDARLDNRFGWRGYWYDPHLQLYHVRHRVYDPRQGQWLQVDPIGFAAGDQNLYRYCDGQFGVGYDPDGLLPPDSPGWDRLAQGIWRIRAEHPDDPVLRVMDRAAMTVTVGMAVGPFIFFAGPAAGGLAIGLGATDAAATTVATGTTVLMTGVTVAYSSEKAGEALYVLKTGERPYDGGAPATTGEKLDAGVDLFFWAVTTGPAAAARPTRGFMPSLPAPPESIRSSDASCGNPIPSKLARVIPTGTPATTLGRPGTPDVFVTAADDIAGMNASQIAGRLGIPQSPTGFTIIEFPAPPSGVASPVFRTDPGFIGGGRTTGGAREFIIPNQPIPPGATTRRVF